LLKTALVPNDKYQHRLGLGKSLGLGSIAIAIKTEQYKSDTRYSIENWRGDFTNPSPKPAVDECLIDPPTLHHLTILGDPAKLTQEVRPPLLNDQLNNPESETYKWFVENDKEKYKENGVYVVKEPWQKQTLRHLEDNLPTLESNWTQLSEYEHTQYLTRLNERNLSDQKKQEVLKKEQENNLKEQEKKIYDNLSEAEQAAYTFDTISSTSGFKFNGEYNADGVQQLTALRVHIVNKAESWTNKEDCRAGVECLERIIGIVGIPNNTKKANIVKKALEYLKAQTNA